MSRSWSAGGLTARRPAFRATGCQLVDDADQATPAASTDKTAEAVGSGRLQGCFLDGFQVAEIDVRHDRNLRKVNEVGKE